MIRHELRCGRLRQSSHIGRMATVTGRFKPGAVVIVLAARYLCKGCRRQDDLPGFILSRILEPEGALKGWLRFVNLP